MAAFGRSEQIGTQHDAIVHDDRDVPIDAHSVGEDRWDLAVGIDLHAAAFPRDDVRASDAISTNLSAMKTLENVATYQHLIDGAEQPSADGRTFEVRNPASGALVARVAEGGANEIGRAV